MSMSDLQRAVRITEKMAKLRDEHEALGVERGHLWYALNRGDPNRPGSGLTYREIANACGVTESKITKAIRREKERNYDYG